MIRSACLVAALVLAAAPSCSKKKEGSSDEAAQPEGADDETAGDKPEKAAPTGSPTSFEANISGGAEGTFEGTMSLVYDMAGFGHISLNANDRSIAVDFNSKNHVRPDVGTIDLVTSNLKGWMGNVDLTDDSGTKSYISRGGTLVIESVDGGLYKGSFDFEAGPDVGEGDAIQVKGSFTAREKK